VDADELAERRATMVADQIARRGIRDPRLLAAMRELPRHEFLPEKDWPHAYEDRPIPIGEGQTISQPYIVAAMTEALDCRPDDHLLDVGTGSGYQAALLSRLVRSVVSIERRPALVARARATLGRLGCVNVTVLEGDGSDGVPVFSPYDAVLVAAGAPRVPTDLTAQLADGGRLVVPVGTAELQHLMVLRRTGERVTEEVREDCVFVPLVGRQGWSVEHPAAK
jgi:protein-L-isoaspartate(D-aspartate) O-methyltransferase|tara:strand:+ start:535 stop:1203 length:669 start_codon:yes stop_codon:yes gene_type:complete